MLTEYSITQETEDGYDNYEVFTFRADLDQKSTWVEVKLGDQWDASPHMVTDGQDTPERLAPLLMEWVAGDWYDLHRPIRIKEFVPVPITENTIDIVRGCKVGDLYISVPHQMPPRLWDATKFPPDEESGDNYVAGDHDWHLVVPLLMGTTYTGHQWVKVQALAKQTLREIEEGK